MLRATPRIAVLKVGQRFDSRLLRDEDREQNTVTDVTCSIHP